MHHHQGINTSMFESLEQRRFLSATLDLGVLTIVGTHKPDNITLTVESGTPDQISVRINGFVRRFAIVDVERINIQAGQGDDFVQIDPGKRQFADVITRIYGSGGNDTLIGGSAKDRIYGGSQNDLIEGNNSRDILYGEAGDDTLIGGRGNDAIFGGDGNDSLVGNLGLDHLWGENGDDTIDALDGTTDYVNGGPGVDQAHADKVDEPLISIEQTLEPS